MALNNTIGQLCVPRRRKEETKDLRMYVYPFKKAGYTNDGINNNYRVAVRVNGSVKTLAYTKTVETANEIAKAVQVLQKEHKAELIALRNQYE